MHYPGYLSDGKNLVFAYIRLDLMHLFNNEECFGLK